MTQLEQTVERQIDFFESRLKHIDELLHRAGNGAVGEPEDAAIHAQIENLASERGKLARHLDTAKRSYTPEDMVMKFGPMAIWDLVAQQLENLVEQLEKK